MILNTFYIIFIRHVTIFVCLILRSSTTSKQSQLHSKIDTTTQTDNLLNAKQNIIQDGDLSIAKTAGLQSALNNISVNIMFYYNIRFDYEGVAFVIPTNNSSFTPDSSVSSNTAQLIRNWILTQTVHMGHPVDILELLYNNCNNLITQYTEEKAKQLKMNGQGTA